MPSGREVGSQLLPGATPCGHIRMAPTGPGLFAATPTRPRGTWVPPRGGRPGTVAPRSSQGAGWPRRHRCLDAFTPPHGEGVPSCPAGVTEQGGDLRSCPLVEDRRASHPNSPRSRALLLPHRPARYRDMEDQGPLRGNGESAIQPVLGPRATGTGTASQSSGSLRSGRRGRPWAGMAVVESLDGGQGARKAGPARRGDVPSGVLFEGGRIYTGDPRHPWATALAAWAGRVIAVGDRGDLRASFPGYRRVDLHGSTVLPGFTDSHIHLASFGLSLRRVNLRSSRSLQEAVAAVAEAVTAATPGEWIQGGGRGDRPGSLHGRAYRPSPRGSCTAHRPAHPPSFGGAPGTGNPRRHASSPRGGYYGCPRHGGRGRPGGSPADTGEGRAPSSRGDDDPRGCSGRCHSAGDSERLRGPHAPHRGREDLRGRRAGISNGQHAAPLRRAARQLRRGGQNTASARRPRHARRLSWNRGRGPRDRRPRQPERP